MLQTCYGHSLTKGTITKIFYCGLDVPTQGILDAGRIFLCNTLSEAFKILEDKVLLKIDFSKDSHIQPYLKTIVSAGRSNINSDHAILVEKFKALATKINFEFLKIRKELKEMQDGRRDNQASQVYMSDDMPPIMPHPSRYFKKPDTSMKEMMREWMTRQTEANERMKNQVSVMASKPKTIQDAIEFATELMDQKIRTFNDRQAKNKRKLDDNLRNNQNQQQPFKKQMDAKDYTAGPGEKKVYGCVRVVFVAFSGALRSV
uniref:Reverse transcriptase domain-containing protein n=1 Tax=Tanacetum cinerariifolium TaxID=118510 RepID=A0A6L2N132_TANCI|nr:reverse transcriptase domain-containing protein [Tanacetum cinerariifolium]